MFVIRAKDLSMEKGVDKIFKNVEFELMQNERIALIGNNGVGKTTLINGLLQLEPFSTGEVQFGIPRSQIGYMTQGAEKETHVSLKKWVMKGDPNDKLKDQLVEFETQLQSEPTNEKIVEDYNKALTKYLDVKGFEWELDIEKALMDMGLNKEVWDIPFKRLSGGQKTRAKLVKLMMENPQFIILDEPTNHLDLDTIKWLEKWLIHFNGTVLFVSHEREFIDRVATGIFELSPKGITKYEGGYQSYEAQKELKEKTLQQQYDKQEKERKKLIETIQQLKGWYASANANASVRDPYAQKKASKQATKYKAKEKALERLESNAIQKVNEPQKMSAHLDSSEFSGERMLRLENGSKSFKQKVILSDINMDVLKGDRIGVIGPNGSGKTTLLNVLAGLSTLDTGNIYHNPQLKIGQFFQEFEQLNLESTIYEEIMELPNMTQTHARTILACFLFRKEDVFKKIVDLSEGEKGRVAFVKLYFSNANLLILDEPTNHFDIASREMIEEALLNYPGSIVLVTHDPYLLRKVTNKIVSIEDSQIHVFDGTYDEFEQHDYILPEEQELWNQLAQLEMSYSQLLIEEELVDEEEKDNHMEKIKQIKSEMERIKNQI